MIDVFSCDDFSVYGVVVFEGDGDANYFEIYVFDNNEELIFFCFGWVWVFGNGVF